MIVSLSLPQKKRKRKENCNREGWKLKLSAKYQIRKTTERDPMGNKVLAPIYLDHDEP